MNDRPAHEQRIRIKWTPVGLGIQQGRIEDPPGWLFVKEAPDGGAAMCFVRDQSHQPIHDEKTCSVCTKNKAEPKRLFLADLSDPL